MARRWGLAWRPIIRPPAVLVWIMSLVAAALLVTFALASRPRWLAWLVPLRA